MYKIQLTCIDPPYAEENAYQDFVAEQFETHNAAYPYLLECVIDEAESLNEPDADNTPRTKNFVICRNYEYNGKKYPAAIVMWDGNAGIEQQIVTLYDIVWVNESTVDPWNQKLKEKYGENLTLFIYSETVEDEEADYNDEDEVPMVEKFYYEGATCGRSDLYNTAEACFEDADNYLENIDLYVTD